MGNGRVRTNVDGSLLLGVIGIINDDAELILMELSRRPPLPRKCFLIGNVGECFLFFDGLRTDISVIVDGRDFLCKGAASKVVKVACTAVCTRTTVLYRLNIIATTLPKGVFPFPGSPSIQSA